MKELRPALSYRLYYNGKNIKQNEKSRFRNLLLSAPSPAMIKWQIHYYFQFFNKCWRINLLQQFLLIHYKIYLSRHIVCVKRCLFLVYNLTNDSNLLHISFNSFVFFFYTKYNAIMSKFGQHFRKFSLKKYKNVVFFSCCMFRT